MNIAALLAVMSPPRLVEVSFTSSTSYTVPNGISLLQTAAGRGAPGANSTPRQYWYRTTIANFYNAGGPGDDTVQTSSSTSAKLYYDPNDETVPADYCDAPVAQGGGAYTIRCQSYPSGSDAGTAATTGGASSAFGCSFPGGTGSATPASTTFSAVAVTAGASYPVAVPAGGVITITFYQ